MRRIRQSTGRFDPQTYGEWHELGTSDATLSVIDIARRLGAKVGNSSPLLRALSVEDVYLSLSPEGTVQTSRGDGATYVHVFSSPTRLVAALSPETATMNVQHSPLAAFARQWPPGTGVRLDPGSAVAYVLEPQDVDHVVATAAGVPTPAALTAVEGEELRLSRGPAEVTNLDERILALGLGSLRRFAAILDGVGGRTWPVYIAETDRESQPAIREIERAAGIPVVGIVNNEPALLLEHLRAGLDGALRLR
jgi:hypothetical protein